MPRFLVVHTMPLTEEEWVEGVKALAAQLPEGITYERTYCNFPDGKFFCDWQSPSAEVLGEILRTAGVPFDEIHPVRLFDAAKGEMESD